MKLGIILAVDRANGVQKTVLASKIRARFGNDLSGLRFAVWGLAFKPDTYDMRDAPSLELIRELVAVVASVRAYDPVAAANARPWLQGLRQVEFAANAEEACIDADAVTIVTEWKEFRSPDFDQIATTLRRRIIFDGRNMYRPTAMRETGFEYHSIGRAAV